jgi:hypothetical protein
MLRGIMQFSLFSSASRLLLCRQPEAVRPGDARALSALPGERSARLRDGSSSSSPLRCQAGGRAHG